MSMILVSSNFDVINELESVLFFFLEEFVENWSYLPVKSSNLDFSLWEDFSL